MTKVWLCSGIHHPKESVRRRVFYIFYKFIKDCKLEIPAEYVTTIVDSMRDVLVVRAELPEPESSEQDLLSEALGSAGLFDSQLYLFESVGTLVSLLSKEPEKQATVLQVIFRLFIRRHHANKHCPDLVYYQPALDKPTTEHTDAHQRTPRHPPHPPSTPCHPCIGLSLQRVPRRTWSNASACACMDSGTKASRRSDSGIAGGYEPAPCYS
jgi:hypothetical protein